MIYREKKSLLILFILSISAYSNVIAQLKNSRSPFKVVGYYFLNAALSDTASTDSNYLFLNKITHLNIAFINPDSSGNFRQHLAIETLIKKAHDKNVKVLASIAGGGPHPYFSSLLQDNERATFIENLVAMAKTYQLDGIDVDLEGDDIDRGCWYCAVSVGVLTLTMAMPGLRQVCQELRKWNNCSIIRIKACTFR